MLPESRSLSPRERIQMAVNITKRVSIQGKGWRFCPVVYSANHRIKPNAVFVVGREELHEEGSYYLDWSENGKRVRVAGGKTATDAAAAAERQEKLIEAR